LSWMRQPGFCSSLKMDATARMQGDT